MASPARSKRSNNRKSRSRSSKRAALEIDEKHSSFHAEYNDDEPEPYVPISVDSGFLGSDLGACSTAGSDFVFTTSQSPKNTKGLTGKISTLFRTPNKRINNSTSDHPEEGQMHASDSNVNNGSRSWGASFRSLAGSASPRSNATSSVDPKGLASLGRSKVSTESAGRGNRVNNPSGKPTTVARQQHKRVFYSSHGDESDDSYESRISRKSNSGGRNSRGRSSRGRSRDSRIGKNSKSRRAQYSVEDDDEGSTHDGGMASSDVSSPRIVRFRGFSTSIKSLFLDEPLVCASMGCFGLLLSNRTEYLLTLRNARRGTLSPRNSIRRRKLPSKVLSYGLVLTILLMFCTFLIWGFGTGHGLASEYYSGHNYYVDDQWYGQWDDNNGNYQGNGYNYNQGYDDVDSGAQNYDDVNNGAANNQNDDANNQDDQAYDDGYNNRMRHRLEEDQVNPYFTNHIYHYRHPSLGVTKIRDVNEYIWKPLFENWWIPMLDMIKAEWNSGKDLLIGENYHHAQRQERENGSSYYDVVEDDQLEKMYTQRQRDIGANIRIALLFTFLLFLGLLGRRRRMRTRFYLVRARAQEDHLYFASSTIGYIRSMPTNATSPSSQTGKVTYGESRDRENQYEGACSHTLCGCYPVDEAGHGEDFEDNVDEVKVGDFGIFRHKRQQRHEDFIARAFNCCAGFCCGVFCKCWFQCLSICALAQEAREIRLLLPTRYQRIDFITHQPFHEYHENATDLRLGWMGKGRHLPGILPHYNALSRFSRYIVVSGSVVIAAIVVTLLFNPRAAFSWQDAVVLAATFVSSFLVLFVVHWIFHKSDLSLDAVIKLFAAGFLIGVPSSFFFEGLIVNIVVFVAWIAYKVGDVTLHEQFSVFIFKHWRVIWILGELFNAYVVAAVTEELCKYYTFRAVEHPDLVFLTGLHMEEREIEDNVAGGVVQYPFSSHHVSESIRDDDSVSVHSSRSRASHRSNQSSHKRRKPYNNRGCDLSDDLMGNTNDQFKMEEPDVRTHRQRAMAITTGMISVAVGLACAENMLYVFVLGGAAANDKGDDYHQGDIIEAWITLFLRSIFPIHALAAAMQSINMIRKFVETADHQGHRIGVGRIIFPAVILHGSFDAVLLGITVYSETSWDVYKKQNEGREPEGTPYNPLILNVVAAASVIFIMMLGLLWYFRENRLQSQRLKDIEENDKSKRNDLCSTDDN